MILHEITDTAFVAMVIAMYERNNYVAARWARRRYSPAAIRERERAREARKSRRTGRHAAVTP